MKRLFILLISFLLIFTFHIISPELLAAQETEAEETETQETETEDVQETPTAGEEVPSYIEMDIRTSTLSELAAWARELGLSDGGTREQLATRLRSYYRIPAARAAASNQRTITIESALATEYFTIEAVDEEYARLRGDVVISLRDGNAIHRVRAWEILYNRTRNVLSAKGNVEYVKQEGDSIETFRGESITVNLDDWSSIFMDGVSERSVSGNASTYRFAGTIISRSAEGATVLSQAEITNPASEEVFWSLSASRLWLLPGNDWAILNAVLRVGNVPLLYFPFFYYPADQLIFHPVMGYRSREGTFLQTTTYVLGRPQSVGISESSISNIFGGGEGGDLVREGIFLRTTGERKADPTNIQLSLLFDAYVNLGFYLGAEFSVPGTERFGDTTVSAGLGLTRDVHFSSGYYTPFAQYDGESNWNRGVLFSLDIPFRYRFDAKGSVNIKDGSLTWELPYYSDPYVDRDFLRRTVGQDWLATIRNWSATDVNISDIYMNSYEWRLSGSYNPSFPDLEPYINSFSVSSFSSSLQFNDRVSRRYSGPATPANPGRAFFFPNLFTLLSVSASLDGTPFTSTSVASNVTPEEGPPPGDALLPDLPIPPWEVFDQEANIILGRGHDQEFILSPPVLSQRFALSSIAGPRFSIDYRLSPTAASEMQFRSTPDNWSEREDINWGEVSTVLTRLRSDGNLAFNFAHGQAYSSSVRLSGTGSWQGFTYLNEYAEEFTSGGRPDQSRINSARNRAYNETFFTTNWDLNNTFRPFVGNPIWGSSSLQHSIRGLLGRTNVDTTGSEPEWDWVFGSWDNDNISAHQVSANLAASMMDNNQTLALTAVMPPKDSSLAANATFRAGISETNIRGRIVFPMDSELRLVEPVHFTETFRFNSDTNFRQNIVYDPELSEFTTFTSTLALSGISASYSATYAEPYRYNYYGSADPNAPDGWILLDEKGFYPRELRVSYGRTFSQNNLWEGRLRFSINLNTSLALDLQRYTNTSFTFGLRANMAITNFLTLTLATNSENVVMFRYLQSLPFFNLPTQLYPGQQTNIFLDLLNSFRFDNNDLRRSSGFKMRSLNMSLTHHLGDWNARLTMRMAPHLPAGSTAYRFSNEISFLIQWVPISELRTEIEYINERLEIR